MLRSGYQIAVFNSLDERYGSTYRLRSLVKLLEDSGHRTQYVEKSGNILDKLLAGIRLALGPYDLFFTQKFNPLTLAALAIARLRAKSTLVDWDDFDPVLQGGPIRRGLSQICERLAPLFCKHVTTHSAVLKTYAEKRGLRVHLVLQGYDETLSASAASHRSAIRSSWNCDPNDCVVIHVCTFTHGGARNLPVILDAWQKITSPKWRFILVGGGPQEKMVRKELEQRGLTSRVILTGLVPHEKVSDFLAAADLGVVYMTDDEGDRARVSLKVIEFLAVGLPIVGRVVGETERQFGRFIRPAEAVDLARAMETAAGAERRAIPDELQNYRWSRIGSALDTAARSAMEKGKRCH